MKKYAFFLAHFYKSIPALSKLFHFEENFYQTFLLEILPKINGQFLPKIFVYEG